MKVLWFTNTPSLASEILHNSTNLGGWIASLEKEVANLNNIELGIAFHYGNEGKKTFSQGTTTYFSVPFPKLDKGHKRGIPSRWMHKIEPQSLVADYLEIIDQFKPDIVHIFGSEQPFGLINDKVNIPVVLQIQGNLTVYEKKWFSGLSNWSILKHSSIKTLIYGYGFWHLYFLFRKRVKREQQFMRNCRHIIGRTDWDRRITRVLSPESRYYHCDELLRSEFLKSTKWCLKNNSKKILHSTLSSINYKGIETVLETAQLFKNRNLLEFEWHIAGLSGKEELVQIIEKAYRIKFADVGVVFLGNLNAIELVTTLLNSDCYIHPSHIENSPNSVCEAMLIGLPVIATYAGGTSSLLTNGIDGFLIQDGDPYSLAGTILELVSDKDLMNEISRNAIERANTRHSKDRVVSDLLNIYSQILSK